LSVSAVGPLKEEHKPLEFSHSGPVLRSH
jgi:hypothetical protein